MKKILTRLVLAVLILAGLYLIPVNLALNLPATLERLNALAPERFAVSWERAWSWYPLRVQLRGVAADGQTPTEQWQLDAGSATASMSLLPLLKGEVRVHDLDLQDIALRLRPRPTPERDYADFKQHFPTIRNRDPEALAEAQSDEEVGALRLAIDDIRVTGEHEFWVSHVRGMLPGELRGSFSLDTGVGQIALADGELDLDGFQVVGETASHRQPDWHARFQVEQAEVVWRKPLHLEMTAGVTIKDTRPFVAILDNV